MEDVDWDEDRKQDYCRGWEEQLRLEVGPKHVLFGEEFSLIGRCFANDDALYQLSDGRVADVHLTWRQSPEPNPVWPETLVYESLDDWEMAKMLPLQRDRNASDR